jgi:hypothetical protein
VLAKYGISDQSYRNWRYRVNGIKPKKQLSRTEKHQILEEGFQNGIKEASAAHGVDPASYFRWEKKFGFLKSRPIPGPPRRFSEEQELTIIKEADKIGSKAVREKYGISPLAEKVQRPLVRNGSGVSQTS